MLKKRIKHIKRKIKEIQKNKFKSAGIVVGVERRKSKAGNKSWFTIKKYFPDKSIETKPINKWNTNDFISYFSVGFRKKFDTSYGFVSIRDRGLMKKLLAEYGVNLLLSGINWLLDNYNNMEIDTPTIPVLWGFRQTIFPKAKNIGKAEIKGDKNRLVKEIDRSM